MNSTPSRPSEHLARALEGAVHVVGRHPVTALILLSELAFYLVAVDVPPSGAWRILAMPAYLVHLLFAVALGLRYWTSLLAALAAALLLDWLIDAARTTKA